MTRPISSYTVIPTIPKELQCLRTIAYNLLWSWDHEIMELFIRIDPDLWEQTNHNPVLMLGKINQERINTLSRDDAFLMQMERACKRFQEYMTGTTPWFKKNHGNSSKPLFAYFSAEFGITESLPNYSGGLGVLSGDHLKSASDLGIPLVGVGLLYQQGYFRQYLNADGWQQERYPENDFYTMPISQLKDDNGNPLTISVDLPGRKVHAQIWLVQVGRISLYLLDTNNPQNSHEDQNITDQLYGGDREMRIKQEILLGIGGYRALQALNISPSVFHLNEGHSAFLALERCVDLMRTHEMNFHEAHEATIASLAFTTHTPVPAGNDYFTSALIDKYFSSYYHQLGISREEFFALGRQEPGNSNEDFCMTVLALHMAGNYNGVSKLHGSVSQSMWQKVWPDVPVKENPIKWITNGVHAPSWISNDLAELFDRYLGPGWREDPGHYGLWSRIHHIPDEEIWRTHERRRERLVAFARHRLAMQMEHRGAPSIEINQAHEALNPKALTIGFARRFATYKRSTLLLRNPERLLKLINDKERPLQIIFAGKAHPHDNPGKDLIREIVHFARRPEARQRILFIEDYDMVVARYLVQGVDVWLNTPRRPLEASGTSGMKASMNGAINLSILDGWWAEAYNSKIGWAIGRGEEYSDAQYHDEVESNALFELLEKEIIPLYYTRGTDDLPRGWIAKLKSAIRVVGPEYNTNRMVREYAEQIYLPAMGHASKLSGSSMSRAKKLASWRIRIEEHWNELEFLDITSDISGTLSVGDRTSVRAKIDFGELSPSDVIVQLYYGPINAQGEIENPKISVMEPASKSKGKIQEYSGTLPLESSGRMGHTVRIIPHHDDLHPAAHPGRIVWAE